MNRVSLNRCLNNEVKYYGLSYYGLLGAGLIGGLVWLKCGMTFGIMGCSVGYVMSSYAAKGWHCGILQRFIYWHLPLKGLFGGKYLPYSHHRCLL